MYLLSNLVWYTGLPTGLSLPIVADLSTYYGIGATTIIETRCNATHKQIGITFNTQLKIAVIRVEPEVKYSFV